MIVIMAAIRENWKSSQNRVKKKLINNITDQTYDTSQMILTSNTMHSVTDHKLGNLPIPLQMNDCTTIHEYIYGPDNDEVVSTIGNTSGYSIVTRSCLLRLKPATSTNEYLNDNIVSFYFTLLQKRDYDWSIKDSKLHSHFFNSFFITKLFQFDEQGNRNSYSYQAVSSWSRRCYN